MSRAVKRIGGEKKIIEIIVKIGRENIIEKVENLEKKMKNGFSWMEKRFKAMEVRLSGMK